MSQDLVARARREQTPLIDGSTVTFLWQGENPPRLQADFNGWENGEGTELFAVGDDIWIHSMELPADAYVEYAFVDPSTGERVLDAFNPRKVSNGMGKYNHFFPMPEAEMDRYTRRRKGVPSGTLTSEIVNGSITVIGEKRKVHFYQPAVDDPCPLLVIWDGQDYLRRARITTVVDNLIYEGRICPIALAMPEHGRQARMLEYGCSDTSLGFLLDFVLPLAHQRLNLTDISQAPGSYGIMGASMGGLMALYTGLRLPKIFGRVLSQSGAFSFPEFEFVVWDLVRCSKPEGSKFWLDSGTMEYLLDCNRRMAALLAEREYDYCYHEYHGGHNYPSWRSDFVDGLAYLFSPQ